MVFKLLIKKKEISKIFHLLYTLLKHHIHHHSNINDNRQFVTKTRAMIAITINNKFLSVLPLEFMIPPPI